MILITDQQNVSEEAVEDAMATGELNPNHYPAQRAAKVVQHYLNTLHGSPYRVLGLQRVHSAHIEDVADSGRKYRLEVSVRGMMDNTTFSCSAEVTFPRGEGQRPAQVHVLCAERLNVNTSVQEEAFYRRYKMNDSLLSAHSLPDSYGHMEPDMKPLWSLGAVASSFVMLNQSNEDTLYNMAQVANVTQLPTENDQLKFDYHVLLHDMMSQDIIHWKLLVTWSPPGGVNVLQMEQLPHCHGCEQPLLADPTAEARNSTTEARNSTAEAHNPFN
ncbi:latexin [Lampetra planeri]